MFFPLGGLYNHRDFGGLTHENQEDMILYHINKIIDTYFFFEIIGVGGWVKHPASGMTSAGVRGLLGILEQ